MVERLDRLRHHAVVGRDHENHDVGGLSTTGTHRGERLVTRGVDEGDRPIGAIVLDVHLIGADVLGDATGLARDHVRLADRVEQLGLAVVDVTHDRHHRRASHQAFLGDIGVEVDVEAGEQLPVLFLGTDDLHVEAEVLTEQQQRLVRAGLGRGDHLAQVEHLLDQRARVGVDLVGEVRQRGSTRQAGPAGPDHAEHPSSSSGAERLSNS